MLKTLLVFISLTYRLSLSPTLFSFLLVRIHVVITYYLSTRFNVLINTFLVHSLCTICLQTAPIVFYHLGCWISESLLSSLFKKLSFKGNELRISLDMLLAALFPLWAFALREACALFKALYMTKHGLNLFLMILKNWNFKNSIKAHNKT